jgi:uncharacterized DUF497 family protein
MAKAIRITELTWDERTIGHIARHNVTVREVEEVCFGSKSFVFRRGDRYIVLGQTNAGRYLFIVIVRTQTGRGHVLTAREMDDSEKRRYRREIR